MILPSHQGEFIKDFAAKVFVTTITSRTRVACFRKCRCEQLEYGTQDLLRFRTVWLR